MMQGNQTLGLNFFNTRFDGTSKKQYEKKKIVTIVKSFIVIPKSSTNPSILALPILPLSKKERRYSNASIGINLRSIFRRMAFSSKWAKEARVRCPSSGSAGRT
ncbi:uncharacterized protein LAJ45_03830 [Morchella importuna]|uniref:uncharacterized protein n=1 Tax=Morchella importuna TaxID=1174673 RepID=UPI001E8D024F|nr:uncharacterized protein LAJ45_03830 [Morchella importuna]KAH8151838.1 hypothetical protein LAJ45_03830 [Morchella importuna]